MSNDELENDWTLGQCVYTMSTGRRCQKEAKSVLVFGGIFKPEFAKHYGYCSDHAFSITRPRDPRIHRTAEQLIKVEQAVAE